MFTITDSRDELEQKQNRILALLAANNLDALLLQRVSSFAWATGGAASYVNTAATEGRAALLITPERRYLITNNIESTRLEQEEKLAAQGWEFRLTPWHETQDAVAKLARDLKLGSDAAYPGAVDLAGQLARLRSLLLPEEIERLRLLAALCAEALESAARAVQPGQTEHEIAGLIALEAERRGVQAIVNLVATDERVYQFRHPLPTGKRLERYAMLVLGGRRRGLCCGLTRFVHFGAVPATLRRKAEAVVKVDAAFISATRPGQTLAGVFERAVAAYADTGFPLEWRLHHQGGPVGYEPREYLALPGSTDVVSAGQAYAWNPTITGAKSEDTILVGEDENEVLTRMADWPALPVEVTGQTVLRPAILEV